MMRQQSPRDRLVSLLSAYDMDGPEDYGGGADAYRSTMMADNRPTNRADMLMGQYGIRNQDDLEGQGDVYRTSAAGAESGGGGRPWWMSGGFNTNRGGVRYNNWSGGQGYKATSPGYQMTGALPDIMRPRAMWQGSSRRVM